MDMNYKNVLIEGDEVPKINIICDVLNEGQRAEFRDLYNRDKKNVKLMHCYSDSFIEYNDDITVCSPLVPYGVVIFMIFLNLQI